MINSTLLDKIVEEMLRVVPLIYLYLFAKCNLDFHNLLLAMSNLTIIKFTHSIVSSTSLLH